MVPDAGLDSGEVDAAADTETDTFADTETDTAEDSETGTGADGGDDTATDTETGTGATGRCVVHVSKGLADYTSHDGSTWTMSLETIQEGIVAASSEGCEVWVKADEYVENIGLFDGVALLGGFNGTETSSDERIPDTYETVIDGDGSGPVVSCVGSLTGGDCGDDAVLDGFTITGGQAEYGGGMINDFASPTVTRCTFTGNAASIGAGMHNINADPILTDCIFTDNNADTSGGGMHNDNASPTLSDCVFVYNAAPDGGGMHNDGASPTLEGCTFTSNESELTGGGVLNENPSTPVLTDCSFTDNETGEAGGAVANANSSPVLEGCTFSGNSAVGGGGAVANLLAASPTFNNCVFSGNSATMAGGAMASAQSETTVTNCVFSDNAVVGSGGAIYENNGSTSAVTNCSFSTNSAENGGGIYIQESTMTLKNTILWGNVDNQIEQMDGTFNVSNCAIEGYRGRGAMDADPLFVDAANGDLRLTCDAPPADCSPCIDMADDDAAPETDLDGYSRQEIADVGGEDIVADIGAYEYQP
jgi:hypothetical protein